MQQIKRWLPLAIIVIVFVCMIVFRWYEYLSFSSLQQHRELITTWVDQHTCWAVFSYMLIYIIATAISVPGAVFLTLAGGFLFGPILGTLFVVISATLGATLLFLAVKSAIGDWIAQKASGWVSKLEQGFNRNSFSYLLSIRLVPIFPFWVINIVAAVLDMDLKRFFLATLIGIIPGSLVYTLVGNGLSAVFAKGQEPNLGIIFQPVILIPLILLALLSLLPVAYKKLKKKSSHD